ncbi:MAG TPA: ABC transporter permease [Solirubrobacteraceae bacterium]
MSATPIAGLGRPIRGPSAFGGSPRRFMNLTWTLAYTDFKLRFFGSALGYLWQLMRPLLLFGVLYVVFNQVLRIGVAVPFYAVVLLANIVLFTFYTEVTNAAITAVVDREGLLRKIQFPRLVIPMAIVVRCAMNLGLNLVAVLIFMIVAGVHFTWRLVEVPFLLAALAAFAAGSAMILSALYVRFRDVKPIWEVFAQALYFGTPVIYTVESVSDRVHFVHVVMSNPLAIMLTQFRHAVVDPHAPTAVQAAGGWGWLAIPIAIFVAVVGLGLWYFDRSAPHIAEEL